MKKLALIGITCFVLYLMLGITAVPALAEDGCPSGCPCCCESVNPHGEKIPPAGWSTEPGTNPNSGKNPDGFYGVWIPPCSCIDMLYVSYVGSSDPQLLGPYTVSPCGLFNFKLTEAKGAAPQVKKMGSSNGKAGAVPYHFLLPGDAQISFYSGGDLIGSTTCVVPPPPK